MKKTIALLMAAMLCIALTACGNKNIETGKIENTENTPEPTENAEIISKEEMLEKAVEIDDYSSEMVANIVRAEAKYVGNIYYVTGLVNDITKDHLNVGDFTVYLPTEDILKLSTGQKITVVGRIDSIGLEESGDPFGGSFKQCALVMKNAYFVTDITEVTGYVTFYYMMLMDIDGRNHNRDGNPEAWVAGLDLTDDNVIEVNYHMEDSIPVEHISGKSITSVQFGGQELTNGMRITVSGKVFQQNGDYVIEDAELVSVG